MAAPIAFNDLFGIYHLRNADLHSLACRAYEFGRNLAESPSAGLTNGFEQHTLRRQKGYVAWMLEQIAVISENPTKDMPQTHPVDFDCDLTAPYETFVTNASGVDRPINEDVNNLARQWMLLAVEIVKCNSASLSSALLDHDAERLTNNVMAIEKFLETTADAGVLDLPESTSPDAPVAPHGRSTGNRLTSN